MKKLINLKSQMVDDMIYGYIAAHGDRVALWSDARVIVRKKAKCRGKVGLVIGNGSGHEPIAMGWIGDGLLDANAVGEVFAAPSSDLILQGIKSADYGAGVLLLISSHSGDILNGEAAVDDALEIGINVKSLLMYDDISSAPKGQEEERRGAPGTTFIYKIVGAAAEEGRDLPGLLSLGQEVRDRTRTLGIALAPGISPLTGKSMFDVSEEEIFIGMGVHGEPGLGRRSMSTASDLINEVMERIIKDFPFVKGDEVIPFINGSGGTTLMELLIVYGEVSKYLEEIGIRMFKPLVAEMVTTQEMAGVSISLLKVDDEMKRLWLAPCSAPYFHL